MDRFETDLLLIPGPTPVPPPVQRALAEPVISHRGSEFKECFANSTALLKQAFQTEGDVITFASSGTGAMEAAISNALSPGDRVLSIENGKFGQRFADIAERFGCDVTRLKAEWGSPATPDAVAEAIDAAPVPFKAITLVHNETSAALTNPTREIVAVAREQGLLAVVDCISGLLSTEFAMDEWGVDIAVAGSQKGMALPPGLAFAAVGERGWDAIDKATSPNYYFDLPAMRKNAAKNQTAYTSATGLFRALEVSLGLILADGMDAVLARQTVLADSVRAAVDALGLPFLADEGYRSNAVTGVDAKGLFDPEKLRAELKSKFQITISGGQDHLKGRIFRISHMGAVAPYQLLGALAALEVVLRGIGYNGFESGAGVTAAGDLLGAALA